MKILSLAALLAAAPLSVHAKGACPAAVKDAVAKAHAGSKIKACKQEKTGDKVQYEVKLKSADGKKIEVDVSPDGAILLTEEEVAASSVPPAVSSAFAARYPKTKATAAEKQTKPDGKIDYEFAFKVKGKKKEATFDEVGAFVSEE
jgi:hypothetical protein